MYLDIHPLYYEARREAEQENGAADWLAFQGWAEDREIPPEHWDAWLDNGHIHPIYRPDLAHTHAPRDWSDDNHGWGEWGDYV